MLVKHLICACTGLPRQDFEWLFQFEGVTPEGALATLGTMQPTSKFGEMFQYSNPLAAAAGFTGGHVAFPELELGAAYDQAMQTRVFDPLGMTATTFDYAAALAGNHAVPHAPDIDGKPAHARDGAQLLDHPGASGRRAPGATCATCWRYVAMELGEGHAARRQALHLARSRCSRAARRRCRSARTRPTAWGSWSTRSTACRWCTTAAT